ncbi:MAG TPA: hypothetical protein VIK17_04415 [Cellulomonas sp.]
MFSWQGVLTQQGYPGEPGSNLGAARGSGRSVRPGRKLGHVTDLGDDLIEVRARARAAVALLSGDAVA